MRQRLTAETWATAALDAIGEGGLAAVAVEPLAARLGATKGSFYWHYANRDALIEAALHLWEQRHTEAVIALTETAGEPRVRLRTLLSTVLGSGTHDRIEANLLAVAEHPLVGPIVQRVTRRRIDYVTGLFEAAGCEPQVARQRALMTFSAYLGHTQLAVRMPQLLPEAGSDEMRAYLDAISELFF